MSELYGVVGKIGASLAETPVSVPTELVFIGVAKSDQKRFTPIRATKRQDLIDQLGDVDLLTLGECVQYAFEHEKIDHAWFINVGTASTTSEAAVSEADVKEGVDALDTMFPNLGVIPNLVCLPYSYRYTSSTVVDYLASKCLSISEKFYAQVVFDQTIDETNILTTPAGLHRLDATTTIDKDCASYNAIACLGCAVMEKDADYNVISYHPLSIVCSVLRAKQDSLNDGEVPSRSVGNLEIKGCVGFGAVYDDGTSEVPVYLTQYDSHNNEWTSRGYIIARNKGGLQFTTWGDHTAAFAEPYSGDELYRFDSSSAMQFHIVNRFVKKWQGIIDNPITLSVRDMILSSEQDYMNSLVTLGALIGKPKVEFRAVDNSQDKLLQGQFHFVGVNTTCIPIKYLELKLSWTAEGLKALVQE